MTTVYKLRTSLEEDRPKIDFTLADNRRNDWLTASEVADGTLPIADFPDLTVAVPHVQATEWDFYSGGSSRGFFSQQFIDFIGKDAFRDYTLLPANMNGSRYYVLRLEKTTDCFDRPKAKYETYPSNPSRIMEVTQYAFHDDRVPRDRFFTTPEEDSRLFLAEPLAEKIRVTNLKGYRLIRLT